MLGMRARRVNEDGTAVDAGNRESNRVWASRPLPTRWPARPQRSSPLLGGLSPPVSPQPTRVSPVYPHETPRGERSWRFPVGNSSSNERAINSEYASRSLLNMTLFRRAKGKGVLRRRPSINWNGVHRKYNAVHLFIATFLPDAGQNTPNQPLSLEIEIGLQDALFAVGIECPPRRTSW
jgi:hypothetical protein